MKVTIHLATASTNVWTFTCMSPAWITSLYTAILKTLYTFLHLFQDMTIWNSRFCCIRSLCYCLHSSNLLFKCQRRNVATQRRKLSIPPTGVMYELTWTQTKLRPPPDARAALPCVPSGSHRTAHDQQCYF